MRGLSTLLGVVKVSFEHAAIGEIINGANHRGIVLHDITLLDELRAEVTLSVADYLSFKTLVGNRGGAVVSVNRTGPWQGLLHLRKRRTLICGILFFLMLSIFLPTRIFFVTVEGNHVISSETIKSSAERCGVYFGALRREVKSERIKNYLLSAVPELQWAGVNTYGCVATISVRERSEDLVKTEGAASGVVARFDGIIKSISASSGNVLCRVGQSVKKGQLLVSAYTDCGISVKLSSAEAEIYGQTLHNISAVMPISRIKRGSSTNQDKKISLIIGKKLINLFKDSGISDTTCVKIYKTCYLTLPGGFVLPVGCVLETQIDYETESVYLMDQAAATQISMLSSKYLLENMVAGDILLSRVQMEKDLDVILLSGAYYCEEMIGQTYSEEIIKPDE